MAREKEKILFNKNHITIKFYENRQYIHGNTSQKVITGGSTIKNDYWSTHEKVKVKKVSKLAPFYYEVEEYKPKPGINFNVHSSGSEQKIVYIDDEHDKGWGKLLAKIFEISGADLQ